MDDIGSSIHVFSHKKDKKSPRIYVIGSKTDGLDDNIMNTKNGQRVAILNEFHKRVITMTHWSIWRRFL